jgi:hypothetical protein
MCDTYSQNADDLRMDANERIVKNTEIDQHWADWLAPTRRSFLFGVGAAAVGLTLGDEARAEEYGATATARSANCFGSGRFAIRRRIGVVLVRFRTAIFDFEQDQRAEYRSLSVFPRKQAASICDDLVDDVRS